MQALRQGGLIFVCNCSIKYSLVISWLVHLYLPATCVVPDGGWTEAAILSCAAVWCRMCKTWPPSHLANSSGPCVYIYFIL